jgi:hypothetical protein
VSRYQFSIATFCENYGVNVAAEHRKIHNVNGGIFTEYARFYRDKCLDFFGDLGITP